MNEAPPLNAYGLLALGGILLTAFVWGHVTKKETHHDARLTWIYFIGLFGALVGAKLAFLFAEGWHYRENWVALLSGRSVTGALLGGYIAVEIGKWNLGYRHTTGDVFAIVVPIGLILGRIGCLLAGCCPGMVCEAHWWTITDAAGAHRWPAAGMELIFNVVFLGWALLAARRHWTPGNRFHIYLIAYGVFRFGHEFVRDDVAWTGRLTGYHLMALMLLVLGAVRFVQRARETRSPTTTG